jgi:hypothetical protein
VCWAAGVLCAAGLTGVLGRREVREEAVLLDARHVDNVVVLLAAQHAHAHTHTHARPPTCQDGRRPATRLAEPPAQCDGRTQSTQCSGS